MLRIAHDIFVGVLRAPVQAEQATPTFITFTPIVQNLER